MWIGASEGDIMTTMVVGSFEGYDKAQRAVDDLALSGFDRRDISILASNTRGEYNPDSAATATNTTTAGAIGVGAVTGGVMGGVPAAALGMVALAVPGVGPIIAAGSFAAALAGATSGAIAGGIIGGLTSVGMPEEKAQSYAESVRRGGAIVAVSVEEREVQRAVEIMRREGALDIDQGAARVTRSG
jgi:hypothetical protein